MSEAESVERYKKYVKSMLDSYADILTKVMFGNFKVRARTEKYDEFASFTMYLNTLIASLERKNDEMMKKTKDLERFNKLAVGRELKMLELKKRIRDLERVQGAGKDQKN